MKVNVQYFVLSYTEKYNNVSELQKFIWAVSFWQNLSVCLQQNVVKYI